MPAAPRIKAMAPPEFALPEKHVMPNGVTVHTVYGGSRDVVRLDVLLGGGYSVQGYPLQALFVNRMLREGAGVLNDAEISRRLDYYGAWIDTYSSQRSNHLILCALEKHLEPLLQMLSTIILEPLFPEDNLETIKRNNKAYYEVNSRKVDVVAQRYFEEALWGKQHPLGHVVKAEDYDNINRDMLVDYYKKVYNHKNCTIFLSGKFNENTLLKVERYLGREQWGASAEKPSVSVAPHVSCYGRNKIVIPGTLQSAVAMGFMAMPSSHSDYHKFRFLTLLLGGYFGSRLVSNIRERNNYTYHIQADLDSYGLNNAFMVSSETANCYVDLLIEEVYHEIERLSAKKVGASELNLVKNYTLGELTREYENVMTKAEAFINIWLSGGEFSAMNDYIETVKSITADEIKELACKYFSKENMIEIVVGD